MKLRQSILDAFDGVSKDGGVSWGQAELIDLYNVPDLVFRNYSRPNAPYPDLNALEDPAGLATHAFPDRDSGWQDLVADPAWNPNPACGGFDYLDAASFRYYLAAAMVRAIDEPHQMPPSRCLTLELDTRKFRAYQWSALTRTQRDTVRDFLRYMIAQDNRYDESEWQWAYDSYWYEEELKAEKEAVRQEIATTFQGVNRDGGTSWAAAEIDDSYGMVDGTEFHDRDSGWEDLVNDPEWDPDVGVGGFVFLDPIGFRYYLAAAMMRGLDKPQVQPQYALTPSGSDYYAECWAGLSGPQRDCVRSYIRYQHKLPDGSSWDEAWTYWDAQDNNDNPDD